MRKVLRGIPKILPRVQWRRARAAKGDTLIVGMKNGDMIVRKQES